jgi:predicted DNA-binding WGR domain protein
MGIAFKEYHNTSRTGAIRVWKIRVEGEEIITEYGQLGGQMQRSIDVGKLRNEGRSNEVSPEQDAITQMERLILKKERGGYVPAGEELASADDFDLFAYFAEHGEMPPNFCLYKPRNEVPPEMEALALAGGAWALRKYCGECIFLLRDMDGVGHIISRRMHGRHHLEDVPWTARFPHLKEQIETRMPLGSLLACELTAPGDADDRWYVARVLKSKTEKALALQEEQGWLTAKIWDVVWWRGEQLVGKIPYSERHTRAILDGADDVMLCPALCLVSSDWAWEEGLDELRRIALDTGWEGFVLVDPDGLMAPGFNLRGKPERPAESCKVKPEYEDDFIAIFDPENGHGKWGNGKYRGQVNSVALFQYDDAGELVLIGNCSGGIDETFRNDHPTPDDYPICVQVAYASRTYISKGDKTNALEHPRIVEVRQDKAPEECINPEL